MNKEIVTDPLSGEDLWIDLRKNIVFLEEIGITRVFLFFGFSWGDDVNEEEWKEIAVPTNEVAEMIVDCEAKGYGTLGDDNLYVGIPELDVKLQYSYETDIHLSYSEKNAFVDQVLARWASEGWKMARGRR
jgi:hypothetical protein